MAGFFFVHAYGGDIPALDEWHFAADHFTKWCNGTLTAADLFSQHNEHRIVFPRLLMLAVAGSTHYNAIAFLYVLQVLFGLIALTFFIAFRTQFKTMPGWLRGAAFLPVALLLLSPRQWESMLIAFQTTTMLTLTAAFVALLLLTRVAQAERRALTAFACALVAGSVSSFSSSMGLLVWLVGILVLLGAPPRARWWMLLAWIATGITCWMLYFHNYVKPPQTPDPWYVFQHPLVFLHYFLACMGGALFWRMPHAAIAGEPLAILCCFALVQTCVLRRWRTNAFWWAIALYALLIMLAIAAGRSGFGVAQALSSRYATFPLLALAATYVLLLDAARITRSWRSWSLAALLPAAVVWSTMPAYVDGCTAGVEFRIHQERNAYLLTAFDEIPNHILASIHPPFYAVTAARDTMQRFACGFMRYRQCGVLFPPSLCMPDLTRLRASTNAMPADCYINGVPLRTQAQVVQFDGTPRFIHIIGWAVDPAAARPAGGMLLFIDDQYLPVFLGASNGDVAQAYGMPCFHAQFEVAVPVSLIGPGSHTVRLLFLSHDRTQYAWYPVSATVNLPPPG